MAKESPRWLEVRQVGAVTVVRFTSHMILGEGPCQATGSALFALVDQEGRRQLLLDFTGVERLDSAMIAKLVWLDRRVKAVEGRLALCGLNPGLAETFGTLKLHRLLNLYGQEREALETFPTENKEGQP